MHFLTPALTTIAAIAVICTLLELLLPEGKLKQSVHLALGIFLLLSIARPIVGLIGTQAPTEIPVAEQAVDEAQEGYAQIVEDVLERSAHK